MLKIGICGGTFDPFHKGHLALIKAAKKSGKLDRIMVIPAGNPPHKQEEVVMPAVYRYEMTSKSLSSLDDIEVLDTEIIRQGRSFTIDTVRQVKNDLPAKAEIYLIFGSDVLYDLEDWHQPDQLLTETTLLLAFRGGDDQEKAKKKAAQISKKYNAKIDFFVAPSIDISSTQIRSLINGKGNWQKYVPRAAANVIAENKFYDFLPEFSLLSYADRHYLADIERRLWPLLTAKRRLHSANVMLYAIKLALIHMANPRQAGITGLLHDCAKNLPVEEQRRLGQKAADPLLMSEELVHGPAGAVLAAQHFAVEDKDVIKSIHYHTTGYGQMTTLDKIIFLADKIEYSRPFQNLKLIREKANYNLDEAMLVCLQEVESFLVRNKLTSHPYAKAAIDYFTGISKTNKEQVN